MLTLCFIKCTHLHNQLVLMEYAPLYGCFIYKWSYFCNKVINLGAQSFKCKVGGGWKLEREQLKGRCKLEISPWDRRMSSSNAWALRVNYISRDFELCVMIQMQGGYVESIWNGAWALRVTKNPNWLFNYIVIIFRCLILHVLHVSYSYHLLSITSI